MFKTYRYRLYPTKSQEQALQNMLFLCCLVYNRCLAERRDAWQNERKTLTAYDQINKLPLWKKEDPRLKETNAQVLQDAVRRLDKTFQAFFRRVKAGEKPGYPRFKSEKRYDSFTYPQGNFQIQNKRISLSRVGLIKIKEHRPLQGNVKTLTIRRQADGWYACFSVEVESVILPPSQKAIGIDLGVESFAITSDGEFFPAAKNLRKAEQKLKRLQRMVSRRRKGSNRRRKAVKLLARAHLRIANQRKDTAHKVARSLVNRYGLIAVEDLNIQGMLSNHHLSKSISDAGWRIFVNILKAKAAEAGRQVIEVDHRNTSQACSGCGVLVPKPLSQRWHECQGCGTSLHRDVNAARNILRKVVSLTQIWARTEPSGIASVSWLDDPRSPAL
jgi:putative transposase